MQAFLNPSADSSSAAGTAFLIPFCPATASRATPIFSLFLQPVLDSYFTYPPQVGQNNLMMFPFLLAEFLYSLAWEFRAKGAALSSVSLIANHEFTLALPDFPAASAGLFVCVDVKIQGTCYTLLLVVADHAPTGPAV
jgi:hypothetical protein